MAAKLRGVQLTNAQYKKILYSCAVLLIVSWVGNFALTWATVTLTRKVDSQGGDLTDSSGNRIATKAKGDRAHFTPNPNFEDDLRRLQEGDEVIFGTTDKTRDDVAGLWQDYEDGVPLSVTWEFGNTTYSQPVHPSSQSLNQLGENGETCDVYKNVQVDQVGGTYEVRCCGAGSNFCDAYSSLSSGERRLCGGAVCAGGYAVLTMEYFAECEECENYDKDYCANVREYLPFCGGDYNAGCGEECKYYHTDYCANYRVDHPGGGVNECGTLYDHCSDCTNYWDMRHTECDDFRLEHLDGGDGGPNECPLPEGATCFSPMSTVIERTKGKMLLEDLQLGDSILARNEVYQPFVMSLHMSQLKQATFLQIHTDGSRNEPSDNAPLEITPNHLIFVDGETLPIPAGQVQTGDLLVGVDGPRKVTEITSVTRDGFFTPLTADATLFVDGILASSMPDATEYVDASIANLHPNYLNFGLFKVHIHTFMGSVIAPLFHAVCTKLDSKHCESQVDDGNGGTYNILIDTGRILLGSPPLYQALLLIILPALGAISLVTYYLFLLAATVAFVVGSVMIAQKKTFVKQKVV